MDDIEIHGLLTAREVKLLCDHVDYMRVSVKMGSKRMTPADRLAAMVVKAYREQKEADAEDEQAD